MAIKTRETTADGVTNNNAPLTNAELDNNFVELQQNKQAVLSEGSFADGDKTKLDGIESGADVTDTTNVTAAGALMDSELTNITAVKALNQGVATTDEPSWDGVNLNAISASIADTAVDVFVYDTRKDSDGGAWRKRCQHTSWYNETLNTSTRGSRKEFPAVAVIVAESTQVTIYDGDDPDMPMWMVFDSASDGSKFIWSSAALTGLAAVNGIICASANNNAWQKYISLISDELLSITASSSAKTVTAGVVKNRNSTGYIWSSMPTVKDWYIVDETSNDIAMTVLPNAPIDDATGLPIPTIAVATDGGVSVIKDDGSVVDDTYSPDGNPESGSISFFNDGYISNRRLLSGNNYHYVVVRKTIPTSDTSVLGQDYWLDSPTTSLSPAFLTYSTHNSQPASAVEKNSIGHGNGLTLLDENATAPANGSVAYITSDYNTGWMNGDIKLATLSDTDDTDVTGSELVTNGTFDTDTTGWTKASGNATFTSVSGQAVLSEGGSAWASNTFTTVAGKKYVLSCDIKTDNASYAAQLQVRNDSGDYTGSILGSNIVETSTSLVTRTNTFIAASTTTTLYAYNNTLGSGATYDNISVRLAEEDRSVNGNGLQVFGTVTKNPVATGADLVAYSGFSTSNYLQQPYNSDLDFGTGDFCIMGWVVGTSVGRVILDRLGADQDGLQGSTTDNTDRLYVYTDANGIAFTVGTTTHSGASSNIDFSSVWSQIVLTRVNGTCYCYQNGDLKSSFSATQNVGDTDHITRLGTGIPYNNAPWTGSLALWRISATAPSAEQIAKIYEDEKVLFQENAKATFSGTSDAVTSLAYDDSCNELLVGTSQATSVFSGLRRVEEISGSASAISASNGLRAIED